MSSATEPLTELLESLQARLATVEGKLGIEGVVVPSGSGSGSGSTVVKEDPKPIRAYDAFCRESVQPFLDACHKLGPEAEIVGATVKEAYMVGQRKLLVMASECKEPEKMPTDLQAVLKELLMPSIQQSSKNIQRNDFELHAKAVMESLNGIQWPAFAPAPRDYIECQIGASDFWANKIRVQYKKTNKDQIEFCDSLKKILVDLMVFVKEYHLTGVTWNPKGMKLADYAGSSSDTPPPPAPAVAVKPAAPKPAIGGGNGLFAELNKGGSVTSGLKKVTSDMQTWKAEYKGKDAKPVPVVKKAPSSASSVVKKAAVAPTKPPSVSYTKIPSPKHIIEYQTKNEGLVEIQVNGINDMICIYNCTDCVIDVKGKCKAVVVDGCKKVKVLFDDCVSGVELVNCQRIQCQTRIKVPTVAIDKCDGVLFYLSRESLDTQFTQSKSSEMNISFPNKDGDMVEYCIPEQFVHSIKDPDTNCKVTSEVSELYS